MIGRGENLISFRKCQNLGQYFNKAMNIVNEVCRQNSGGHGGLEPLFVEYGWMQGKLCQFDASFLILGFFLTFKAGSLVSDG